MSYNYKRTSWQDVRDLFRKWRESNDRRSEEVIQLWEAILEKRQSRLGHEKYMVLEQVILSALDCGRLDIAEQIIKVLSKTFPESLRVLRFEAMKLEALNRYDEALDVLDKIINLDDSNADPRKRKIAILKARGRNTEAIKELTDYINQFMSDKEAWQALGDLYLAEGEFSRAAFCIEEVMLHNPYNHLLHQRLADIKYTEGGFENMEIAKSYYNHSIQLNANNIRSLYGLFLVCTSLANSQKLSAGKKKENVKLSQWALRQIKSIHETQHSNSNLTVGLESALTALEI